MPESELIIQLRDLNAQLRKTNATLAEIVKALNDLRDSETQIYPVT